MKKIVLILLACAGVTSAQTYFVAIKSTEPASLEFVASQVPEGVEVVDFAVWRDVPTAYRQYNPAHYPAVVSVETGRQAFRPSTWQEALDTLTETADSVVYRYKAENALIALLRVLGVLEAEDAETTASTEAQARVSLMQMSTSTDPAVKAQYLELSQRLNNAMDTVKFFGGDPAASQYRVEYE